MVQNGNNVQNGDNMKKIGIITAISIIVTVGSFWSVSQYRKYQKTTPKYALEILGKAFVTGEEKYISASEELMDTDLMANVFVRNLIDDCTEYLYPDLYDDDSIKNWSTVYDKRMSAEDKITHEVQAIIKDIRFAVAFDYEKANVWSQSIEKIEYKKRRLDGELTTIAVAYVKMKSGIVFKIILYKENNTWIPRKLANAKETICKWISSIEKISTVRGKDEFGVVKRGYVRVAINSSEKELQKYEKELSTKRDTAK